MIAKPSIPESDIRRLIGKCNEIIDADQFPSMRRYWTNMRGGYMAMLEQWREYRRSAAMSRAIHQRPSVRRHIARKVKMPL